MAESQIHELSPYKRYLFWPLVFIPSLLALSVAFVIYFILGQQNFHETQQELMGIAQRTSHFIPTDAHERLQKREDMQGEDYKLIELYLQSIMSGNDKIDDIYTLRPTGKEHLMTFVVSGDSTRDKNGNGTIEENEVKAMLGEEYNTSDLPDLEAGFFGPSVDREITYDKWGAFLSGYAPLKDAEGKTVAILGVDFRADTISQERHTLLLRVLIGLGITIPLIVVMAWFLTWRATKPFMAFIRAMDKVRHGNYGYEIPHEGKHDERVVAELFNTNKELLMRLGAERNEEKRRKKT